MQDGQQGVKPTDATPQPEQKPTVFNYFGLKYKGWDDAKIYASKKPDQSITLLSAQDNWNKYGAKGIADGKWKNQDDFNKQYTDISSAYTTFKKSEEMHRKGQKASEIPVVKKGENVDYSAQFTPYVAPVKYAGAGTMVTGSGDIVRTGTEQQVAFDKGYAIDDETGKKVKLSDTGTFATKYIAPAVEDGSPEVHIASIFDRLKSGQAVAWMGPETSHATWMSEFLNGIFSSGTDILGYAGGLVRMAGDAATSVMNAFDDKDFKSDSELADKWNQPEYAKFANMLENISTGAKKQSEDFNNSFLYGITNMVGMIGGIAITGGVAGVADGVLGLGEESAIQLSKAATHIAIAGMVAEPFLKECNDAGIPAGKAAVMAMGVVAAVSLVSHKIGADAVWNTFAKMQGDGVLKKSMLDGIEKETKATGSTDINKVPDSGWKRIVSKIVGKIAKAGDNIAVAGNTFNAAIKGGLGMADFTFTQNAAKTAWDEYEKKVNPKAEQGEGLFYKRNSSAASNLTEGLGSSFFMGAIGSGLFSAGENILLESKNKGANSELRNRYMEKEIFQGRYKELVDLIIREWKKGTWGMRSVGEDGNAIKAGEQKRNMNDVNTEMLLKQAELIKEIYDKHITDKPEFVREKLGNDKQLQLEMIRNIGATRKNSAELESVKNGLEEKKNGNSGYEGKEEMEKIDQLTKNNERLKSEYDDLTSGRRYSRKYNGYELQRAGLPDVSDGMEKLIKNKQDELAKSESGRLNENNEIANRRISVKSFDLRLKALPENFDILKHPEDEESLERVMNTIEQHGINDKNAISRIHDFVQKQLSKIPEFTSDYQETDLQEKLKAYNTILENKEGVLKERNREHDTDKFNENWLLNKNNPSGLETENRVNELHDLSKSERPEDKKVLAELPPSHLESLAKDLPEIETKAKAFDVYRDIPEKHSGMSPDENISKKTTDAVEDKIKDLFQKLIEISNASGAALKDKKTAQHKLATEEFNFNHTQIGKIAASNIVKFDETTMNAIRVGDTLIGKINEDAKKGIYDNEKLNLLEQNHNIIESFLHDKLNKVTGLQLKLENLLISEKEKFYLYTDTGASIDTINKSKTASPAVIERNDAVTKVKAIQNYLQAIKSVSSKKVYLALQDAIKESGLTPSFEQTNIKQAIGFLFNPDNGFINEFKNNGTGIISNGYSIIGAAGVGKTHVFLPLLFKTFAKMGGDLNGDILIMGPNDEHMKPLEKALRDAGSKAKVERLSISEFVEKSKDELQKEKFSKKYSHIICDEASGFSRDAVSKFRDLTSGDSTFEGNNKSARCLFLIDPYQAGALEENYTIAPILESTQTGKPLQINYRTGSTDNQSLGERFKSMLADVFKNHVGSEYLPVARCNPEETFGDKYVDRIQELHEQFFKSFMKSEGIKPWLVVKDQKAAEKSYKKLISMGAPESVRAYIKTISMFNDVSGSPFTTAQGRQNPKIYVLLDPSDFSSQRLGQVQYLKFIFTAVTRAGGGEGNSDGFCCLYVPPEKGWKAKNGDNLKAGEGKAKGIDVNKVELQKRLETVNKPFAGEKVEPTEAIQTSKQTEKDNSKPSPVNYESTPSEPGEHLTTPPVWKTRHDELAKKDILVVQGGKGEQAESLPILAELSKKLADPFGEVPHVYLKYHEKKTFGNKEFRDVVSIYSDENETGYLGNLNLVEDNFENKVNDNDADIIKKINSHSLPDRREKNAKLLSLRNKAKQEGIMKIPVEQIFPGEMHRGKGPISISEFKKNNPSLEYSAGLMKYDADGKPFYSMTATHPGMETGVEFKVFTPTLTKEDIDRLNKSVAEIPATTLYEYYKQDPEILKTIDYNQSTIKKLIAEGNEKISGLFTDTGTIVNISDKFLGQANNEAQVTNLKRFYEVLRTDPKIAERFYLCPPLDKNQNFEANKGWVLDKQSSNYNRLQTYFDKLSPPELYIKWSDTGEDFNKKPTTNVGEQFRSKITPANFNTDSDEPSFLLDEPTVENEEKEQEQKESFFDDEKNEDEKSKKIDSSLVSIFGNSSVVNTIKNTIYKNIGFPLPGDVIKADGTPADYMSLSDKIAKYRKDISSAYELIPKEVKDAATKENYLTHPDKQEAFILDNLADENILNLFISKLYPEKEGGKQYHEENNNYDVKRNIDSTLKNIISSIPLFKYSRTEGKWASVDSGYTVNPRILFSELQLLLSGVKDDAGIKRKIMEYASGFKDRVGELEDKENAILSFSKVFFSNPDVKEPGKYSYSFIRDNKPMIESKEGFPMLKDSEAFQKHSNDISNLVNHFYSIFKSNTTNNYVWAEYDDKKWSTATASALPWDEIKNKLQGTSNTELIDNKGREKFDSKRFGTKDGKMVIYADDGSVLLKENKGGDLGFSFEKGVRDRDISKLFSLMGINMDYRTPGYFNKISHGGGDVQFTKDRLATIAGVFATAIRASHDKEFGSKYFGRLKDILTSQKGAIENPLKEFPLPSDYHRYIRNLAIAEHSVIQDAFRDKYVNVNGDTQQTIVLGSHVTDIFDNGSESVRLQHENLSQIPEYSGKLRNTLNQVKNGKMSFDKIGVIDGIKSFTKSVKFGDTATSLDVLNIALRSFRTNEGRFNIMGEYGGDGTNIRMYPIKIEEVSKLTDDKGLSKELKDYGVKSFKDIFSVYHQEFQDSKNKWKKYIGAGINDEMWNQLKPADIKGIFEKKIESLKKAKNKEKYFEFVRAIDNDPDLVVNKDKFIKDDYSKATQRDPETGKLIPIPIIKLGHATTFNEEIDPIFNGSNFYTLQAQSMEGPEFGVYEKFYNQFIDRDLEHIINAGITGIDDNEIRAYSLLRMIALKNINPLVHGDENQYKSRDDYQKRTKESPGLKGAVNSELTVEQKASMTPEQIKYHTSLAQLPVVTTAVIPDINVESEILSSLFGKNEVVNRSDGKQIINPFYEKQFVNAFGGEYGPLGKGAFKLRTKGVNPITGIAYDDKCQTMRLNWELLDKSSNVGIENIVQDNPLRESLDSYLKLMLSPRLYDMFKSEQLSSGTKAAIENMQEQLKEHPEWHDEMIHFLSHESVRKTGTRSRNVGITDYTGLSTDTIESKNILHQLNLDKDDEKQVLNRQLISALGIGLHNSEGVEGIDRAQMNKLDVMWRDIDKHIGVSKDSPLFTEKLKNYLQSEAAKDLDEMNYNFLAAVLMSSSDISVDIPMLSDKVQGKLIGIINKGILSKMQGLMNVNDDSIYYKYRTGSDGNRYGYDAIRKMGEANAMKLGLHEAPDEDYKIMQFTEDGVKPADVIGSYSPENKVCFGIRPGEDVTDIFSIHFKDGSFINTENYTSENLAELLKNTDPDTIDFEKTPMFRETENFSKENLPDDEFISEILKPYNDHIKKIVNYHQQFSKSLDGISIRIPYSGMPFGKLSRIRSFVSDYGSFQASNGDWNKMDGQDLDGDKQTFYTFQKENPEKPEIAENNYLLKQIMNIYSDPKNADVIFHPENIDEYKEEKKVNDKTGLENTLSNYQKNIAGKQCIAIEASFSTIYKALYRATFKNSAAPATILGTLKINSGDIDIYGQHISSQIATILQMALDNPKEDILGRNGVNQESIKVLNSILMYTSKVIEGEFLPGVPIDKKIKEGFAFLKLPEVRSVYDEYFKLSSIGETKKSVPDIIDSRMSDMASLIEKVMMDNMTKPEDEAMLMMLKNELINLGKLKELEMLGEGVAQLNTITHTYTKGIPYGGYERDRMLHGSRSIEFLLNAPADKIFGPKEDYEKFISDSTNENYFMGKYPYKLPEEQYEKELSRQKEIRKNVDYRKFFEQSPLIKKQWESFYRADQDLNDAFLNRKPFEDLRNNVKAATGIQNYPVEKTARKLEKEISKFLNSLYYSMKYSGNHIYRTSPDNYYTLGNTIGRERFSTDVVKKFMEIKFDERYKNNKALQMLEVSSIGKELKITLKGGNRIPPEAMLDLQKAMRELDVRKDGVPVYDSGLKADGKALSMYDIFSHYSAINDNFSSGGNSLVNLFDQKAYKNFSDWIKNTVIPKIKGNEKFSLLNGVGDKVELSWNELLASFKDKMLGDAKNADLLLSRKRAAGADYFKEKGEVFKNGVQVNRTVSNSDYGYDLAKDLINNSAKDKDLNNEGTAPVNTPKDIQLNHYQKVMPEDSGKSDIEKFLSRTSDKIIQNERLRNLAESYLNLPNVLEGLKGVKVGFGDTGRPDARGMYTNGIIIIRDDDRDPSRVFMHELHHPIFNDVLSRPEDELSDFEKEFKQNISTLYEHAKESIDMEGLYGVKDIREFVPEAFSNPDFQDRLMRVKSPESWKSVWRKMVEHLADFVSNILGISKEKLRDTLLNDIFAVTHDYLQKRELSEKEQPTFERMNPGTFYLLDETPKDPILALRTILLDKPVQNRESMDSDHIRESIHRTAYKKSNGDRIYYIHNDKRNPVNIGKGEPTEEQIRHIQDLMQEISEDKIDNFILAMNADGTPEAFAQHFGLREDGSPYFDNKVHEYLPQVMDFDIHRGDKMVSFDEYAKTLGIENDFRGNKPIIILHNTGLNESLEQDNDLKDFIQKDKNGNVIDEISVFDITSKNITNLHPGKHIWETKTEKIGERQLRNFQLALTLMKIEEKKNNVAFKRTGVLQLTKNHINWSFDINMSELGFLGSFKNYLKTASGSKFMETMPASIKEMLVNPSENPLLNSKYGQDYLWQLAKNWEQKKGSNGFKDYQAGISAIHKFMTEGGEDGYKVKEILLNRSKELNRMNSEARKTPEWKRERSYIDNSIYELNSSNWSGYGGDGNISFMTKLLSTDPNVGNPYTDSLNLEKYRAHQGIANETVMYKSNVVKPLIDAVLEEDGTLKVLNNTGLIKEQTSKIFDKYVRKVYAKDTDGNVHRINTKMLHFNSNDEETKKEIEAGTITKKEVEIGKKIADELFILFGNVLRQKYEEDGLSGALLDKKVKDGLGDEHTPGDEYRYGMIPTLPKELGEKWLGINLPKMMKMAMEPNVQQPELLGDKTGRINNYFADQMGSDIDFGNAELVGKMMGISKTNTGEWIIDDLKKVNNISYNFEHLLTSMKMMELRQKKYHEDVIPVYDVVRRLADEAAVLTNSPMENVKQYFEEWKMANIDQKVRHLGEEGTLMRNVETVATAIAHAGGSLTTSLSAPIAIVVAMANTMGSAIKAVSNSIGNTGMFGLPEYLKAASKLFTEKKKMNGIGDMYGVMNMTQRDIQRNPSHRILKKTIFSSFSMHWPVWAIDYTTREMMMTAQMLKDGKYDAHTYNKETGKVEYDEKKDRQIWNADGSQTSSQKAIREAHRRGLIEDKTEGYQKLIDDPNSPLPKGYSTSTGVQILKDVSDQVIYNMGDDAHMNIQNSFLGRMVTQFKLYPLGQLEQAFSGPYKRLASGHMVTVMDEYGHEVAKWQPQDYEGALHTVFHSVKNLKSLLKNPKEFWENLTPKQKANLVALGADIIMFIGMWMIWNNDEIKKNKKIADTIKRGSFDLVNPYNPQFWIDSFKEPIPMINFAVSAGQALFLAATGQFEKALKVEPIGKGDIGLIEQYAGYKAPVEHKKKKVESN